MAERSATEISIRVPGMLIARLDGDKIVGWTFTPHGSDAGYFGPAAEVLTYPTPEPELDVESTDGPFWRAVQAYLGEGELRADWVE